ncbi:hypothetical protein BV25DRAFT_1767165, partial [Artomyces pyxidatus]
LQRAGLNVEDEKTEFIHFSRKRGGLNNPPSITLPSASGGGTFTVHPSPVLRYLGVFFDSKLNFRKHVETMANRAMSTIRGLQVLGNSVRGMSLVNFRTLYRTVVLPVLTFGAPIWYTGKRQKTLVNILTRAQ